MKKEKATFGMGCFWGPQFLFDEILGVMKTVVGYMGGDEKKYKNPSYKEVCSGRTGYIEIVYIEFDSDKVSYEKLLNIFWKNHNPTTGNRQGFDFGSQYRSMIFYYSDSQKKAAEKSRDTEQKKIGKKKITTEIVKAGKLVRAEDYHQKYLEKRGRKTC